MAGVLRFPFAYLANKRHKVVMRPVFDIGGNIRLVVVMTCFPNG